MEILDPPLDDGADRPTCEHGPATAADPRSAGCEECGSRINLRSCAHCGHVGCCESQAAHARQHALGEHHPVIEQVTPTGVGWAWCYEE
ncbi:MAG TPA: UBP-type zinc finger domain-containing protein, partial [Candidatus Limnocylindria bacterium]|nr:UBP-type zinc finger domain-containing protein [Candidatus Limnocylindria bacterium]